MEFDGRVTPRLARALSTAICTRVDSQREYGCSALNAGGILRIEYAIIGNSSGLFQRYFRIVSAHVEYLFCNVFIELTNS